MLEGPPFGATTLLVCFYHDAIILQAPFVSYIELRLLDPNAYQTP